MTLPSADHHERLPVRAYTEKAYLDYSMYVILDRALPFIGDGLKPVQRRLVYAMSELGLSAASKHKKSARTVGDVLGKYHPHGDSACYEAMVLMAQPFSYRYPIVDGQGNWGSSDDPKSFAAMRYTEARLARYAEVLLSEVALGTVDWVPNFDGTLTEPAQLPARLPNLLLNGTTGIAVGMATDILPHNLREVASACIHVLDNPDASLDDLLTHLPAPDFPTGGEIISNRETLREIYHSGRGSVRVRAVWGRDGSDIIITELPYQVSGARILEQIAQQMMARKLPQIVDVRDESDHENPTRIVIVPRSNRIDLETTMLHLFASTDLERTYRVNMNVLGVDGRPRVRGLLEILKEWLAWRTDTVTRRLQFRLQKVLDRLHILEGLLIAYLDIDEVIAIIRNEDEPRPVLMQRFGLSEIQADYVLDTRLRQLARLEEMKIRAEQDELEKERLQLDALLNSPRKLRSLIRKEIAADSERYGDARRSPVVQRTEARALTEADLLSNDPVTVVLSQKGWIRSAKGHDIDPRALSYKAGDGFQTSVCCRSNETLVVFDSTGRAYSLPVHDLPSARGQGEPLSSRLSPPSGAEFLYLCRGNGADKLLLSSSAGYGFVTTLDELQGKNRSGKAVVTVKSPATLLAPQRVPESSDAQVVAVSSDGRMLVFPLEDLPRLSRGKGNRILNIQTARLLAGEESMLQAVAVTQADSLVLHAGKRFLKLAWRDLAHYVGERGRRGNKLPRGLQRVDRIEIEAGAASPAAD